MPPRPHWWHVLQASKNEVRLAVDLYNRSGQERQLEAFIVHMSMGWLKLLQARVEKVGGDLYIRNKRGWRIRHEDGDWKYKPLSVLAGDYFGDRDPRKSNLEFFVGLRNRIEHRHEKDIATLVSGKTQAHLLNYEDTLVTEFGQDEALGEELRFPLFVSTLTTGAIGAVKSLRDRVPKGVLEWVRDYEARLEQEISADQAYDFRVYLVPHSGPKTEADAVMTFVKPGELSDEQRQVVEQVQTIIREKKVPVEDLRRYRAAEVVEHVAPRVSSKFGMHEHTQAWRYFAVRPPSDAEDPTLTKSDFCHYNAAFKQYVYTPAWVEFLVRKVADPETYAAVLAWRPQS